ncbi:response regulator [Mariprofundus sp. NF]|uniref:hybrid sensor histidine kinase/response regulator n=1 Tax=Mariprofundus sp. NF TaxID=2608716 RepID=UPI0015A31C0B|nr:hybrid sensor histidine kinase/response regulator [Mariprofundus sp. NF]NWF39829.1 response regulator [Mariprofundus sp. NF]
MKRIKLGFGARIYLLVALLIMAIMAAAASYFLVTQSQALKGALSQQARSLSESLAEGVRLGVVLEDGEFVQQVASGMLGLPNILYIDIYLADGTLLQRLGEKKHDLKLPEAMKARALSTGFSESKSEINQSSSGYVDFMVPVRFEGEESQVAGFVRLGLSTTGITKKWQETLITTIWATLLLMMIGCALIYLPMRRIIKPIEQLSDGALKIGQGNLDFKISVDHKDEIGRLAGNFNDMASSLRKQNREIQKKTHELERSERKFRELFENIAQPLYINALDGQLIDCNMAMVHLFGFTDRAEMIQEIRDGALIYADPDERQNVIRELLAKGEIKEREIEFKRKDGAILKTLVTSRVRFDDEDEAIGFEGIIQDVTQMRSLEEQLFHVQKMESIGTLAGGIAHDFNNLLAAILSSAEMARMKIEDRESVERYITTITSASLRAAELTKGLLGFARKGKTRVEEIDAGALVAEVEALLRETIDRSVRIYTDVSPSLWPIRGNPTQVHQVLVNLCVNARDAILDAGGHELKISLRNEVIDQAFVDTHPSALCGSYVLIDVTDDGGGIPDDVRDQIFDPFFTTKAIGKGTGLGLATVYGIIKNHGGFLYLDSALGKGTTFHIYLPAAIEEEIVETESLLHTEIGELSPLPEGEMNGAILFVDDEEVLRFIVSEFLKERGYHVLLAENGKQALEMMAKYSDLIDLMVLDLIMPEMGGEEVLKVVKRDYPEIPVIVASGYSAQSLDRKMVYQNYDGYLEKPYDLAHFSTVIEEVISSS